MQTDANGLAIYRVNHGGTDQNLFYYALAEELAAHAKSADTGGTCCSKTILRSALV